MKRIFVLVLMIIMLMALSLPAFSETISIDLSLLSYEDLVTLKDQITLAMWNSKDWQEVTVPQGVYQVGVDIPAGHWTIRPTETTRYSYCFIKCGMALDSTKKDLEWDDSYMYESLASEKSEDYDPVTDKSESDFELVDGIYVIVEGSSAVFTPYTGKPSLGFK